MSYHAQKLTECQHRYKEAVQSYRYDIFAAEEVYGALRSYYLSDPTRFIGEEISKYLSKRDLIILSAIHASEVTIAFMSASEEIAKKRIWPTTTAVKYNLGKGSLIFDLIDAGIIVYEDCMYSVTFK